MSEEQLSMQIYAHGAAAFLEKAKDFFSGLASFPLAEKIDLLNALRLLLHTESPFVAEPVDCVLWKPLSDIEANDYNPNTVAPPEMELLHRSIEADGYTQPIVAWQRDDGLYEVVDGFHRHRIAREKEDVAKRLQGYAPVTVINNTREDRGDRIAATIRHNRARGKHRVDAMSDIVIELKRRNWSYERIGRELGMDTDEVLRLTQIAGLSEMFADQAFSEAWEHTGAAGAEIPIDDEDLEIPSLEWMNGIKRSDRVAGWHDRTDKSSVLYGEHGQHLGVIQKSRFKENEWFCYAYCCPSVRGTEIDIESAKSFVEKIYASNTQTPVRTL